MGLCVIEGSGYRDGYNAALDLFTTKEGITVSYEESCPSNSWSDYGYEDPASGHWIRSTCRICGKQFYANSYTPNHPVHMRTISSTGTFQYRQLQ